MVECNIMNIYAIYICNIFTYNVHILYVNIVCERKRERESRKCIVKGGSKIELMWLFFARSLTLTLRVRRKFKCNTPLAINFTCAATCYSFTLLVDVKTQTRNTHSSTYMRSLTLSSKTKPPIWSSSRPLIVSRVSPTRIVLFLAGPVKVKLGRRLM